MKPRVTERNGVERGGGSWSVPSRPRVDKHPLQKKLLFEKESA